MSLQNRSRVGLAVLATLCGASTAFAQVDPILNSFTNGTYFYAYSTGGQDTVGWDFTVTQPITINALGYYDEGANGLAASHPVGLWELSGSAPTLIATATIDNNDQAGPTFAVTATINGQFLFDTFTGGGTVTLVPGVTYVVGGYVPAGTTAAATDGYRSTTVAPSFDAGIVFGQARRDTAGTATDLTFPDVATAGNGRFGPNIGNITLTCAADFNGDTIVDFFDYLDFVAAFSGNEPSSDFNADTIVDFFDYLDFVAAFSSGCP